MTIPSDYDEQRDDSGDEQHARITRELPAVGKDTTPLAAVVPEPEPVADALPELPVFVPPAGPVADVSEDDLPTVMQPGVAPAPVTPRARKTTLITAISRPSSSQPQAPQAPQAQQAPQQAPLPDDLAVPLADEIPDEIDEEWAIADQPTIQLPPRSSRVRPDFLDTGEQPNWPAASSTVAAGSMPMQPPQPRSPRIAVPPQPRREPISRPPALQGQRLATPTGRPMPSTPPDGTPRAALPDPRMQRFQELHRRRLAAAGADGALASGQPVTEAVTKWWNDARPGLARALRFQHEARDTGTFPIPAYEPSTISLLGDVFGRLAASARQLSDRAQAFAGPTIKRIHDQAEHAAQAIVDRFEGNPVPQQEPFLGKGRIAVFFRPGVTVGQAQRLLAASQARPVRIIPRKHGFLAFVQPGLEQAISERLEVHPYVRKVDYIEYREFGDAAEAAPSF